MKKVWTTTMDSPMVNENVLALCNRMGVNGWEPFHIEPGRIYSNGGGDRPTVYFKRLDTVSEWEPKIMDRKIIGEGGEVTLYTGDMGGVPPVIIMGIDGKSQNPDRHAVKLTPDEARRLAKLLNAIADLS